MIRKIVQHGPTTLITSLPRKWCEKFSLKRGDEINVEIKGEQLLLSPIKRVEAPKKASFDFRGYDEKIVDVVIAVVHKVGYDEVEVLFDNPIIPQRCQKRINQMLAGYEIVEQSSGRLLIKNILTSEGDFDNLTRRLFLVALTFTRELYSAIENKQNITEIMNLEMTVNKLSNLCERILNTEFYREKTDFYYLIVWNIESIGDHYRDIAEYIMQSKISVSKETMRWFTKMNEFLERYYNFYYKFDLKELLEIKKQFKQNRDEMGRYILILKNKKEISIMISLMGVNQRIDDGIGATLAVNV